jgi:hypothetical protein
MLVCKRSAQQASSPAVLIQFFTEFSMGRLAGVSVLTTANSTATAAAAAAARIGWTVGFR